MGIYTILVSCHGITCSWGLFCAVMWLPSIIMHPGCVWVQSIATWKKHRLAHWIMFESDQKYLTMQRETHNRERFWNRSEFLNLSIGRDDRRETRPMRRKIHFEAILYFSHKRCRILLLISMMPRNWCRPILGALIWGILRVKRAVINVEFWLGNDFTTNPIIHGLKRVRYFGWTVYIFMTFGKRY